MRFSTAPGFAEKREPLRSKEQAIRIGKPFIALISYHFFLSSPVLQLEWFLSHYLPFLRYGVSIPFQSIAHYLRVNAIVTFRSIADSTLCQEQQSPTDMKGILLTFAKRWNLSIPLPLKRTSAKPIGTKPFLSDTTQRRLGLIKPEGLPVRLRIGNASGQVPLIAQEKLVVRCSVSWIKIYCWAYQR